jgi:zinc protease
MGDTPGGRLHRVLVAPGRAAGSFGETLALADPGALLLGLQFSTGQDAQAGAAALAEVAEGVAAQPVDEVEFRRAQARWLKAWEQQFSDPERVGVALSESVALGDWRLFFLLRDRVQQATLADVNRVAAQRLVRANRTLALYLPTDKPQRAPEPQRAVLAEQLLAFKPRPAPPVVPPFDASPAHLDTRTTSRTLPGGLKLALLPKPTRGNAVRVEIELRHGDLASLKGQAEVAQMVANLLDKGAQGLDRQQVRDRLDQLKTELSVSASAGSATLDLVSRREHVVEAIALVGRLLRTPSFPAAALEELRRQGLAALQAQRDDPEALAERQLARRGNPYAPGDPRYVPTVDEAEAELKAVTLARVQDFHQRFYGASVGEVAVVGDFDAEAVAQAVQAALGDWKSPTPATRVPLPLWNRTPGRELLRTPDKQNATLGLRLALPLSDNDAEYPAFYLANYLLGSGGNSRLWKRLREKEGLSYSVYSWVDWSRHEPHSVWQVSAIFAPQNLARVEQGLREEFDRALRDGFTAAEVQQGRQALLAARRLSRAQDANLAAQLAGNAELGRRFAFSQKVDEAIAAATPEQVNAALRKYLKPEVLAVVAAGDFKAP